MKVILIILSIALFHNIVFAQDIDSVKTDEEDSTDSQTMAPYIVDTIVNIRNLSRLRDTAMLEEVISFKLKQQKASVYSRIFVDGIELPDLKPWKTNDFENLVYFKMDKRIKQTLDSILPKGSYNEIILPVYFSLSDTSGKFRAVAKDKFYLKIKRSVDKIWGYIIGILVLVLASISLRYDILKDDTNSYYSLGRSQLFFWTLIFAFSYVAIWVLTGTLPEITDSVLIILGISAGTTAASKVIENRDLLKAPVDANAKSEGWFLDILSDGSSINIHRFQNVIFNVVFGLVFIQKSFSLLAIPDFDSNVLILMGISSGTYAGLKVTETQKEQSPPVAEEIKKENADG